jgi:hypothetical protein
MEEPRQEVALPPVLIPLFKGVVYRDENPQLWQSLLRVQPRVQEYVQVLGLDLLLHEGEGYAYLRQNPGNEDQDELPRLVPRRQLGYPVSLLLALLRKKLAEHDASGADPRLILTREQIVDLVRLFVADTTNEVRMVNRIEADINKAVQMGFLRRLRGEEGRFEVRRILGAFVDAQWLSELEERLRNYREHAVDGAGSDDHKEAD